MPLSVSYPPLRRLTQHCSCTCSEDVGTAMDGTLMGGRFELMQQRLRVGGRDITLIVPRDVDAVMEMYIDAGEAYGCCVLANVLANRRCRRLSVVRRLVQSVKLCREQAAGCAPSQPGSCWDCSTRTGFVLSSNRSLALYERSCPASIRVAAFLRHRKVGRIRLEGMDALQGRRIGTRTGRGRGRRRSPWRRRFWSNRSWWPARASRTWAPGSASPASPRHWQVCDHSSEG